KIANRNYRVRDGWKLNSTEGRLRLRSRDKFCASSLKFESPDLCSSLCNLCVLCVSVVNDCLEKTTTEAQRTQRLHREIRVCAKPSELVRTEVMNEMTAISFEPDAACATQPAHAVTIDLPDHQVALTPDMPWAVWRWVCLRGAGFPATDLLQLAS